MPQILVGGDNPDAYSICDAIEQKTAERGLPVVFCTTPHEVLNTLGHGGAAAIVLNFEQAGLTNFELAYRIRETDTSGSVPLLLPEVDALGDVTGALGKHVGIFAFPVNPDDVADLACKLLDEAKPAAPPRPPVKTAPPPAASKEGAAPRRPSEERTRLLMPRLEHLPAKPVTAQVEASQATEAAETQQRLRRVRHRTWNEVHMPRHLRARPPAEVEPEEPEELPEAEDEEAKPRAAEHGRKVDPKLLRVVLVLLVAAVPLFAFYGYRAYRSAKEDRANAAPKEVADVMCVLCGARESRPVTNIHGIRCRKCGGHVGFSFHCNDCKKDFAFVPPANVKTLSGLKTKPVCAACKSWNIKAIGPGATPAPAPAAAAARPAGKATAPTAPPKRSSKPAAAAAEE